MMRCAGVMLLVVMAGIPPLTPEERTALETAFDGRDHREAAFDALLDHTGTWSGELGDAPIRLSPDIAAMIASPEEYRGELCRVSGRLEQVEPLRPPFQGVNAWFVRSGESPPILVYVNHRHAANDGPLVQFTPGEMVEIDARFYKIITETARDGEAHTYAAFVGAHPRRAGAGPQRPAESDRFLSLMIVSIILLGVVFLVLFLLARRGGARDRARAMHPLDRSSEAPPDTDVLDLPDDPADAMLVLRQHAEQD